MTDSNSEHPLVLEDASTARVEELWLSAAVESTDRSLAHLVDTRVSLRAAVRSTSVGNVHWYGVSSTHAPLGCRPGG